MRGEGGCELGSTLNFVHTLCSTHITCDTCSIHRKAIADAHAACQIERASRLPAPNGCLHVLVL